jgi:hypothetical protein
MLKLNNKLTKSALLSLILVTSLSGCATLPSISNPFSKNKETKPLEVVTKAEEKTKLNIVPPEPLNLKSPRFVIIHPENSEQVWKTLKENGNDVVLFGLSDDDYETLAIMMAEIRNFIITQRLIIEQYKQYYEAKEAKKDVVKEEPKKQ